MEGRKVDYLGLYYLLIIMKVVKYDWISFVCSNSNGFVDMKMKAIDFILN